MKKRVAMIIDALSTRGMLADVLSVAERYHVPLTELVGQGRTKTVSRARRHAMLTLREKHRLSYPEIGSLFDRDHSTVIYSCRLAQLEREAEGLAT